MIAYYQCPTCGYTESRQHESFQVSESGFECPRKNHKNCLATALVMQLRFVMDDPGPGWVVNVNGVAPEDVAGIVEDVKRRNAPSS